jgi:hypothetical protein
VRTGFRAALQPHAVVAIPACNEAARIEACLAALAAQRDSFGAPLEDGSFQILVFANNCDDGTEETVRRFAPVCPHPVLVVSEQLGPERANAGCARKRAMDIAADRLLKHGHHGGILLTTDADSCVSPTWFAATMEAMAGVDCVAGYVDALPGEMMGLGAAFVRRGRLEDRYLRLMAEIHALCDPRTHDPWPNHRVSSGASLAVKLTAYLAIGGMPAQALGEDHAFTRALDLAGFLVRRPMSVTVGTSCRFDGRAKGGAADTMRLRHAVTEAPCDEDVEPAMLVVRSALRRGALRRARNSKLERTSRWAGRFGFSDLEWQNLVARSEGLPFEAFWAKVAASSPLLSRRRTLRPSELPEQITRAEALLRRLRVRDAARPASDRAGTRRRQGAHGEAIALP